MRFKLNKSVTLNWPRKSGTEEKVETHEIRVGVFTPHLPEDVATYLLENYKDNIISVEEEEIAKPTVEELVKEIKEATPVKEKEFAAKESSKPKPEAGLKLADIAKLA